MTRQHVPSSVCWAAATRLRWQSGGVQPLDPHSVATYLRRRFGSDAGDTFEVIAGGTWSQAFAIAIKGRRLVVRFGGDRVEYAKDRLAATWSSPEAPIPEVLEIGEAFDRPFVVSQYVDGSPLDGLDEAGWRRTVPALLDALAALREVDLPGSGYGPFDERGDAGESSWSGWLRRRVDAPGEGRIAGWQSALASVPGALERYEAGVEQFDAALAAIAADSERRRVVHADLGAGNTLTAEGRVTGIIDWGNAVAGDPLYDIAHLTFWAPWHHGCPEELVRRKAADVLGDADFEARVLAYELHISLAAQRFNAAMGRFHLLDDLAARTARLAGP